MTRKPVEDNPLVSHPPRTLRRPALAGPTLQGDPLPPLLRLVRPLHWAKNLLVLAPLLFSASFLDPTAVAAALLAMLLFTLAASIGYVYNDLRDRENDRRHPLKRQTRPLASGETTPRQAWALLGGLFGLLALGALLVPWTVGLILAGYLAMGVAYSGGLKRVPFLDILIVASGFVLRVLAGAVAIAVPLSLWMAITTLFLAMFLVACKRLAELRHHAARARRVLVRYARPGLVAICLAAGTGAFLFYGIYTLEEPRLLPTIPLVLAGLWRYWHLVQVNDKGENPLREALGDRLIVSVAAFWAVAAAYAMWPG